MVTYVILFGNSLVARVCFFDGVYWTDLGCFISFFTSNEVNSRDEFEADPELVIDAAIVQYLENCAAYRRIFT